MSNNLNSMLMSGQIQLTSGLNTTSSTTSSSTSTSTTSTITSDFDIFPVGQSIDPTKYVYDGQTTLMINSTLSPNTNIVKAQYFDPVSGYPNGSSSNGFGNWNFNETNTSYLNGAYSASSLLSESTYLYNNLQPISNTLGAYTLDITDGSTLTGSTTNSGETLFFSLTSQPYVSFKGSYSSPGTGTPAGINVNPSYTANNSDNFLFTSNYYVQQKNEIIIVQLVFTVSNTNALNVANTNSSVSYSAPTVSLIVYNKVIPKDALASLSSGYSAESNKTKVYTAGPIPIQYTQSGGTFNSKSGSFNIANNVPIIIADGYNKLYATMPLIYVPPVLSGSNYVGQYLNAGLNALPGYQILANLPNVPQPSPVTVNSTVTSPTVATNFGHFVVGISFSTNFSSFNPGSAIYSQILIKNIWRSPIAIYNSYSAYSINDMATKQVVLLFGKTFNGGTFLVTNSGTAISMIDNYAVTSLRNFIQIMRAVLSLFDGSSSLVDYFINPNTVQQVNSIGSYNIQVLTLQPLLDGGISNPASALLCPNMNYMFLKSTNSATMSVDPTSQTVFGQSIGKNYFGLQNSTLCSTGTAKYVNSQLNMLTTNNGELFGNSVYLGLNTVNNQLFYMLLILPEAQFNATPSTSTSNVMSIYSTPSSLFYINTSTNASAQFSPQSTSGTTTSQAASKINMSVSNIPII